MLGRKAARREWKVQQSIRRLSPYCRCLGPHLESVIAPRLLGPAGGSSARGSRSRTMPEPTQSWSSALRLGVHSIVTHSGHARTFPCRPFDFETASRAGFQAKARR